MGNALPHAHHISMHQISNAYLVLLLAALAPRLPHAHHA